MIRHAFYALAFILALSPSAAAQLAPAELPAPPGVGQGPVPETQPPPPGPPKGVVRAPVVPPGTPPPAPAPPGPPVRRGRDVNVQVELTINDQEGTGKPETRVVSLIVADARFGRIRSTAETGVEKLNVDASPELLDGDRIALSIAVEYVPARDENAVRRPAMLNEQMTVILQSGKPLLISQAADPMADRKTTVEVKATIIK